MSVAEIIEPAKHRSVFGSFLLVFIAGPLGALYVGVKFAAIYLVIAIGLSIVTGGVGAVLVWMFYWFYAPQAARRENEAEIERVRFEKLAIQEKHSALQLEEKRHQELLDAVKQGNHRNLSDIEL